MPAGRGMSGDKLGPGNGKFIPHGPVTPDGHFTSTFRGSLHRFCQKLQQSLACKQHFEPFLALGSACSTEAPASIL